MGHVLSFLKGYKKECFLAPFFKLFEALLELFVPLVMAAIIDNGIVNRDNIYILKMSGILVLLGISGLAASVTAQFFAARAAVGMATKLRFSMFSHIEGFSFSQIDSYGTSTLITRLTSDVNQVQNGVNMVLRLFLRSPFIVAGAMVMAFTIDKKTSVYFLLTIIILSIIVFGIMKITIPLYRKVQNDLDALLTDTRQNISGARVIRAFNKENDEIDNFDNDNNSLKAIQVKVGKISGLMNPLTYAIVNTGIMILIWKGAKLVEIGTLSQGQVIALINYMSQILVELVKLANLIVTITKAIACAKRVSDIFDIDLEDDFNIEAGETSCVKDGEAAIEFDKVCLTYNQGADEALTDISFSINKGQTLGIIGGTGSGKTSLVHLIPAFYEATKGCVKVNGLDVKEWNKVKLRQKVGIVLQKAVLFKGTIEENLLWGNADNSSKELQEWLDISQSKEFVEGKENGINELIEQGGKNLSGGQKQRLTIARALARKPEILILDDSSSALDYATDAKLRNALSKLENMTVVIVSQRTSSIRGADKIIVLDDGRIVGVGTHEELLGKCEQYREIHETQIKTGGK